jgi:kynurenine formamidase
MNIRLLYLSHLIDKNTPTYGNRNKVELIQKSSMKNGNVANDSSISSTVHIGTHIDMPYHFFEDGQTIEDFEVEYFHFENVLFLEINPTTLIINEELIQELENITDRHRYELLVVKTGICYKRETVAFWESNYGFDPKLADYIRDNFPNIRVFGFDSISISCFQNRILGKEAHRSFLNPKHPILLLEDMDLRELNSDTIFNKVIIAPLRIAKCDGLPCSVIAEIVK